MIAAVQSVRSISASAYVLRFDRGDLRFVPGQYLNIGRRGAVAAREYSIYSGVDEPFLEALIKEVENGEVSQALRRLAPGDELVVDGPFGFFTLDEEQLDVPHLFVASGTGIAPFHCFASSYDAIEYTLLHGIRSNADRYDAATFAQERYVPCVSREPPGGFGGYGGRVTGWLREHPVDPETRCYLCGSSDMIFEAFDLLKGYGVPGERLFAEVYF